MEIHELNNFSGTLGASDYFATDNGSDTTKISANDLFAPLNARIDNIIAGGDAPSEAEVTDARLGATALGSQTYPSLGDAIRGQVTQLYDGITKNSGVIENISGEIAFTILNKKVADGSGNIISSSNFACIVTHIPNGSVLKVDKALDIQNVYYTSAGVFVARGALNSLAAGATIPIYNSSASYVFINVRYPNASNPPDAGDFLKSIHIRSTDATEHYNIQGDSIEWEYGRIADDGTESYTYDGIRMSAQSPIKDTLVVSAGSGITFRGVFKLKNGGYTASQAYTGTHKFEVSPTQESFRLTARYSNNSPIFDINDILNNMEFNDVSAYIYRGHVTDEGRTTFEACQSAGYYGFTASDLENLTDKPSNLANGGVLRVEVNVATGQVFQTIVNTLGMTWFRYGSDPFVVAEGRDVVWYALGDSITQGFTGAGGEISGITNNNWVTNVAKLNGYTYTNYGVGGSGYLHNGTVEDMTNAKEKVDLINFAGCDLVTLAYGVNDWHYQMAIGSVADDKDAGNSMCSNMKYCIEKILGDNPYCKIIVLTPFNCAKYGGDFSTNWGLGYALPTSGTLQSVVDAIISVCEYYGVEYIDQSETSIVNRVNINNVLGDGIHPTAELYPVLAKDLASKIDMR